jgi:hypothetical protein
MMVSFAGVPMMLIGSGANDLLDVLHTESCWKAKQVNVSVDQPVIDATAAKAAADAGAADTPAKRRQRAAVGYGSWASH